MEVLPLLVALWPGSIASKAPQSFAKHPSNTCEVIENARALAKAPTQVDPAGTSCKKLFPKIAALGSRDPRRKGAAEPMA